MAEVKNDINDILFLLQKIESIIDTRLIGEIEPDDDEISLIAGYQERKKKGTLVLHEI
ncbi:MULTISPECIES: hypothetical protein [Methanocalculus]|uniref:hypothetical protein n=1 Tax=Methanocalculus TaxID=71151 RepID=UPI00209E15DB|nr:MULTISPECIES: hypothetical protein [unclassified Methanocalculus]MCP1662442.1 hypothetical protein [Methanocalculus sp. AMF5]